MNTWPRHILMTADTLGGVWTFALELTRCLIARGVNVTLATTGRPLTEDQRAEVKAAGDPAVFESSCLLEWQENPWDDVESMGAWLQRIAAKVSPDLLHLNDYSNASRDWNLPVVVTGHSCVLSWFKAVRNIDAPLEWDEYRRRIQSGLRAADIVTAPSPAMLRCLETHYGPLARTMVIPNARRASQFHSRAKEPFILTAGRVWDEAKNVSLLAQAAEHLPWPVYAAGDQQGACFPNVHSLGPLSSGTLASWMSRASIYCLPAKYEPFGLSILEAALSGCALVLGDIESLRETWDQCACFVDPFDPAAFYETVRELIRNTALRTNLADNARERGRRFTPHRMTSAYLHSYSAARSAFCEKSFSERVSA